ncbi:OmpW/AlkL family protein [Candidatus Sororendozoicomonas aggregata]|uniref:OmpW/AlkL family protein n=1 Tax=Candidatus Sororendozoicomonas aggregata TaxID=3073239 RepID=UPI002ED276C6
MNKKKLPLVAATLASLVAPTVSAYQEGDMIVRGGAAFITSKEKTFSLGTIASKIEKPSGSIQLEAAFTYMLSDRYGFELSTSTPYKHNWNVDYNEQFSGKAATIKVMPVNLVVQAYLLDESNPLQPYVGFGINYTHYNVETEKSTESKLNAKDTWGGVAQFGADYMLSDSLMLNAAATYRQSETDLKANDDNQGVLVKSNGVSLSAWSFRIGLAYKFN